MLHVDFKKRPCRPVEFTKRLCHHVDSKKASCRHVNFKKVPCRMPLTPTRGCTCRRVDFRGVHTLSRPGFIAVQ